MEACSKTVFPARKKQLGFQMITRHPVAVLVATSNVTESVTDSVKSGRGALAEILVLIGTAGGMLPPAECPRQSVLGSLLEPRGRMSPNQSPIR